MNHWYYVCIGGLYFFIAISGFGRLAAQTEKHWPAAKKSSSGAVRDSVPAGERAEPAWLESDTLRPGKRRGERIPAGNRSSGHAGMAPTKIDTVSKNGAGDDVPDKNSSDKETSGREASEGNSPGKDEIRLNETFRRAIESGRFLPAEPGSLSPSPAGDAEGGFRLPGGYATSGSQPLGTLNGASGHLPLAADFSEYLGPDPFLPDTLRRLIDSAGLTPQLLMLQQLRPKPGRTLRKEAYMPPRRVGWDKGLRLGKWPVDAKVSAGNLFLEEVRDGQRRGSINITVTGRFSMEELLEKIFWKSARNKARNRKRENTWKYYNDMP